MLGVLPDQHGEVHHWLEQLHQRRELVHQVELLKVLAQGLEEFDVVVGLLPGCLHLLDEPAEGGVVGALDQLQHLDHLLDLLALQLVVDGVEVCCALCPEVQLHQGTRVHTRLLQQRSSMSVDQVGVCVQVLGW